ncbi:hypothetical protein [Saccharothrix obliqua]|uniref:hypothetical protein n=1 Tax=Saccharothrix obliqua TaxID=2861747 RepID=UPI001C5FA56C|nr:hypothetical protein [Saccharothrix obliqua]MBW4718776.1 hypothetical protein [Saccharothrix obliqua]
MNDHPDITDVAPLAATLLEEARGHSARRAARTLVTGTSLRATLIALAAGAEMDEHEAPLAATLQAVIGDVVLHSDGREQPVPEGRLAPVPPTRHSLTAVTDAVVLLTVALR